MLRRLESSTRSAPRLSCIAQIDRIQYDQRERFGQVYGKAIIPLHTPWMKHEFAYDPLVASTAFVGALQADENSGHCITTYQRPA